MESNHITVVYKWTAKPGKLDELEGAPRGTIGNLAEELGNVSKACQVMGLSRDTFYRYKAAVDDGGVDALLEKDRRKPNLKNRTDPVTEEAVLKYALEQPAHGQVRTSNELRKRGIFISPSGVRCDWLRHELARFKDRLKALEEKSSSWRKEYNSFRPHSSLDNLTPVNFGRSNWKSRKPVMLHVWDLGEAQLERSPPQ